MVMVVVVIGEKNWRTIRREAGDRSGGIQRGPCRRCMDQPGEGNSCLLVSRLGGGLGGVE